MRAKARKIKLGVRKISDKVTLLVIMCATFSLTTYFVANAYEQTTSYDIPKISTITSYTITKDKNLNDELVKDYFNSFDNGSFGVPRKIRFPENSKHVEIKKAKYTKGDWKAQRGVAQMFITNNERQKAFGESVIYLRTDSMSASSVGEFFFGDVVNIITDKGWQLGYSVNEVTDDITKINRQQNKSTILVVLVNDSTGQTTAFSATLSVVGERT